MKKIRIVSLFSGCGGLDKGFENAGFDVVWANEYDSKIWATFEKNFPKTKLDRRSIRLVESSEIPKADGVIGGPPCQSWSEAGALRGIEDKRGQLFFEFVRVLKDKQPTFFLAENVSGMLAARHEKAFKKILKYFSGAGYVVEWKLLNVSDFGVPQDRKRVIFVGYRKDIGKKFIFPEPHKEKNTLKNAIWDLRNNAKAAAPNKRDSMPKLRIANHEYMTGGFSSMYMSRNRVRCWGEQSFTIQAGGRHAPLHPQANTMIKVEKNKQIFDPESPKPYRRLSVRECARIQTFPDDYKFVYENVSDGYKMVGNAVPVSLAEILAEKISEDLKKVF